MTFCSVELCVIPCFLFHDGAVVGPGVQQVPTYLNHPALVHSNNPDNTNPDSGYFESQPIVEFPDDHWDSYDEAEYPDQALLCPDYSTYPGAYYPAEGGPDESRYEY